MASCLYLFKICLYENQFITDNHNIQDVMILSKYIMLIQVSYFIKYTLAITAPQNEGICGLIWLSIENLYHHVSGQDDQSNTGVSHEPLMTPV